MKSMLLGLTEAEKEQLYSMVEMITGNCQQGHYRKDVILFGVLRRMRIHSCTRLADYIALTETNTTEYMYFLHALTIHTTEWFRESAQYKKLDEALSARFEQNSMPAKKIRVLSAGCATGEEVYSFALFFEKLRRQKPLFNYIFSAFDIDVLSIDAAKKATYSLHGLKSIPSEYHFFVQKKPLVSSFEIASEVKSKCSFYVESLTKIKESSASHKFEMIICRNVLIYFSPERVQEIVRKLLQQLAPGGFFIVGQSDRLDVKSHQLQPLGNSIYIK